MGVEINQEKNQKIDYKKPRPPIVVILGHIDHGKTTLIDYIRKTKVAEKEAGGITQHIGAYQIEHHGKIITFLDTPGHEAFSAIRSRGAKVADIAILVVAADEGVKTQTKEAVKHIQEAKIPFIVAINKIDKETANQNMVKKQLVDLGILLEEWGGKIPSISISAKTGKNVDHLLDLIILIAEIEELKAEEDKNAQGVIIESHLDQRRGFVATLLVQEGTLNLNDYVVSGGIFAKIKAMEDFKGENITKALPSQPVLTLGWLNSPDVGEKFLATKDREEAEKLSAQNLKIEQPLFIKEFGPQEEIKKILNIIFKADTKGSLEAISEAIKEIRHDEVGYNVVGYGIGDINSKDVKTLTQGGVIYGFYVGVDESIKKLADKEKVSIKTSRVIYELVEELRKDLSNLLEPEIKREVFGKVKVLKLFKKTANSQIVGGKVISGYAKRGAMIDVFRDDAKIISGRLAQLQHNKVEVEEVKEGLECGIRFEGSPLIEEGNILEIYEEKKIKRSL